MYSLVLVQMFSFCAYLLSYSSAQKEPMHIPFSIFSTSGQCISPTEDFQLEENQKIRVIANSNGTRFSNRKHTCYLEERNDSSPTNTFLTLSVDQDRVKIFSENVTFGSENNGTYLICIFVMDLGDPNKGPTTITQQQQQQSNNNLNVTCNKVQLFVKKRGSAEVKLPVTDEKSNGTSTTVTISCVVGVIVILIIIGQSIALLYFKSRAQVRNRLDSLVTQDRHFDRNDEARYSAPPNRRNTKTNRATAETDSHIYEMVGVNALYKESTELDIKNRPPLPLPGESPVPPPVPLDTLPRPGKSKMMSSTLDLNTISSKPLAAKPVKKELPPTPVTTMTKAPCRPPKPVETDSPAASLPRPPKPGTSLARPPKPNSSLPRPPKPGSSMPKMPPTDPGLMELKKALEKRNAGNAASPSISQQSTLEMPPKTPNKAQPSPTLAKPGKTLVGAVNPLAPNMKLLIPKIEASLKQPPRKSSKPDVSQPRATEPSAGAPSIQPVKPGVPPFRRPNPESSASSASAAAPLRPPQTLTAPLRPPQTLAKPRPLPPIQPEEDETNSDDEEWTYEQLEKFNIYNV